VIGLIQFILTQSINPMDIDDADRHRKKQTQTQTDKTVTLGNIPVSEDSKAEKPALIGTH